MYCSLHTQTPFFHNLDRFNLFRNFSGCRCPILLFSFPTPYSKLFYCKNSRSYDKKKMTSRKRWCGFSTRFGFVQTYLAISRAVGIQFCLSIGFLTPYSKLFYCKNSRSCDEKNTTSRKQWCGFSTGFGFVQTYFPISWAVGVRFYFLKPSINFSFH